MKNHATKLALRRHHKTRPMPKVELPDPLFGEELHCVAERVVRWVEQENTPAFFMCGDRMIDVYPGDGRRMVHRRCLDAQGGKGSYQAWRQNHPAVK